MRKEVHLIMQKTLSSSMHASYRSVLMSTIGTITTANIVRVMIASRKNCTSVANYVERILRLKKRNVGAVENVVTLAWIILVHVSNDIRDRDLNERNSGDTHTDVSSTFDTQSGCRYEHKNRKDIFRSAHNKPTRRVGI